MRLSNMTIRFLLLTLFLGLWNAGFGQEKEILKILNRELKEEVKHQLKSPNFNGDTIKIIKEFTIDNNKNLTFQIKKTSPYFSGYQIIKQEVPLDKIVKIGKDINIIFETEEKSVVTTTKTSDNEEVLEGSLFFLYLSNEKENEKLGIEIQKAFQKAGYKISKEYWYD